jgi:phosphatidylserine/phosphatidylglycerophosphate/cardiolipin synthase-like enzyme
VAKQSTFQPKAIDQTIQKNLDKLSKPGVLTVRPGYEIAGDQLTGKQAIVATVHTKLSKADLSSKDLLPDKIGAYPVDVREASPYQRLRATDPASADVAETYGLPADNDPIWPNERELPSGKLITSPASAIGKALVSSKKTQPAAHQALASFSKKPEVPGGYEPPATAPALVRFQLNNATVIAHVSPDAGFKTLSSFLADTQKTLVIGMYDFTSGPILQAFLADLDGTKTLQMVLDSPAPNPTRDQTDVQTVQILDSSLGARAKIARALVRTDKFASEWLFPSAYHIKVIVRDGNTVWLSSGNLNNSNQPDLSRPPTTEDRDWHVIITDAGLAQTFSSYLNYDFNEAMKYQAPDQSAIAPAIAGAAIENAELKKQTNTNPPASKAAGPLVNPVSAKTFKNVSSFITPLLTPDVIAATKQPQYLTNIINLIDSAQKSIYIQLQYIESSATDNTNAFYTNLLEAIAKKVAAGLDVKLIESRQYGVKWIEKMKAGGVDLTANIALQYNVHNKGFVIDSKMVVVSSQNFSPAGVHDNRDAGVIIENEDIASYFESIFLSDWTNKTIPASSADSSKAAPAATGKKGTPVKAAKAVAKKAAKKAVKAPATPAKKGAAKKAKKGTKAGK